MNEVIAPFVTRYKCKCGFWREQGFDNCLDAQRAAKRIVLDHLTETKCEQDSDLWEVEIMHSGTRYWPGDIIEPVKLPLPRPQ